VGSFPLDVDKHVGNTENPVENALFNVENPFLLFKKILKPFSINGSMVWIQFFHIFSTYMENM